MGFGKILDANLYHFIFLYSFFESKVGGIFFVTPRPKLLPLNLTPNFKMINYLIIFLKVFKF